jgi:septum site-determining protein MinD
VLVATPDRQSLQDAAKTAAMARELDAPPVMTTLVRSRGVVDPDPLLEVPTTVHVPEVSLPPLEAKASKNRYRAVVTGLIERNV